MTTKRVLVLANSIKKGGRCVAGREVFLRDGRLRLAGWIRPVSNLGEGELLPQHYALQCGGELQILEVVDMVLASHRNDPGQPENWLLAGNRQWKRIGRLSAARVACLGEEPRDLWLESGGHADRISVAAQAGRTPQRSIVLIKPTDFKVRLWRKRNPFRGYVQRRTQAIFSYRNARYGLSLTDPSFNRMHCSDHPAEGEKPREFVPACAEKCLLCISLTPPFNGYHYKVVASVLSMP